MVISTRNPCNCKETKKRYCPCTCTGRNAQIAACARSDGSRKLLLTVRNFVKTVDNALTTVHGDYRSTGTVEVAYE